MGRPRKPPADKPPARPNQIEGLKSITIQLDPSDFLRIEEIKIALDLYTGTFSGQTRAIRWAIRDLACRLRQAGHGSMEGSIVPPPE